ncbi:MAG TPA: DotH/IcmK family type IV secretion protein [Patescibacteria group bacterium]|nr:DotH/IcmK family type IV secretion protein [Patescibacteria group bacterium]
MLFSTVVLAVIGMHTAAFAQEKGLDEFEAFRNKLNANKGGAGAPAGAPSSGGASGIVSPDDEDEPAALDPVAGGNPGMGLPVGKAAPGGGAMGFGATPQTPEELQAMMEQEQEDAKRKMEEQTFNSALKQLLPLRPDQIRKTLETFRMSREAAETPITVPEPKMEVQTASLDPSGSPVVIKVAPGNVTSVTILDATGAPWPIQDMVTAGPFSIMAPEEGGNVIRITPSTAHGVGNISMRLVDMITPVTFRVQTGMDWVHYRLDVRIPKPGPLAKTPLIEYGGLKAVAGKDEQLVSVLDGTPPEDAVRLLVEGVDGRTTAWEVAGRTYLRTPLTLLSPTWDESVTSADGMNVYAMGRAPVVLLSDEGRMVKARIIPADDLSDDLASDKVSQ